MTANPESTPSQHIRSFIRRQGRITAAQSRALEDLWPRFGVEAEESLNAEERFGRTAPLVLEIGFGNGDSLATMAQAHPENDYIGIEVHRPGVGHLLLRLEEYALENVRIYCADALEILNHHIADGQLDRVQLFFPDPWPKKRHHKRRIVNPEFLALISRKLKPGGIFHAATDWQPYAEHMAEVLANSPDLTSLLPGEPYAPRPDYRPLTKFETRGQRLGHGVWDLLYARGEDLHPEYAGTIARLFAPDDLPGNEWICVHNCTTDKLEIRIGSTNEEIEPSKFKFIVGLNFQTPQILQIRRTEEAYSATYTDIFIDYGMSVLIGNSTIIFTSDDGRTTERKT